MSIPATSYRGLINQNVEAQKKLFQSPEFSDQDNIAGSYKVIIIGSGIGGGILADSLSERRKQDKILVIEAGSYVLPTHVYNVTRQSNSDVAQGFEVENFRQDWMSHHGRDQKWPHGYMGDPERRGTEQYLHEFPQLNFGGRSIFWSGLIPSLQEWELGFFPPSVAQALRANQHNAGERMNQSRSLGKYARKIVDCLNASPLANHFVCEETPRALHQPYLNPDGTPRDFFYHEPTGVYNTAELLANQVERNGNLRVALNHYVEKVERDDAAGKWLVTCSFIENRQSSNSSGAGTVMQRRFHADKVVLAAGSMESPKILRRSPVFNTLQPSIQDMVGRGLTDHPTTDQLEGAVTHLDDWYFPIDAHAKLILYSKGHGEYANGQQVSKVRYPFNVEINLNPYLWHLRENDPTEPNPNKPGGSTLQIKFSFGNCLDNGNSLEFNADPANTYRPEVRFKNLNWTDALTGSRFPALAEWNKSSNEVFWVLNEVADSIFGLFRNHGSQAKPNQWLGDDSKGFGLGTVHHACGTLRMTHKTEIAGAVNLQGVVDDNLQVNGQQGLYVCDMSVMPFSPAANPVRPLAVLALRLAEHLS